MPWAHLWEFMYCISPLNLHTKTNHKYEFIPEIVEPNLNLRIHITYFNTEFKCTCIHLLQNKNSYTWIHEHVGRRFAAALLPRLFGTNPRSHHKGATGRVRTGDQLLPVLCHCQLGQVNSNLTWFHTRHLFTILHIMCTLNLCVHFTYKFICMWIIHMNSWIIP